LGIGLRLAGHRAVECPESADARRVQPCDPVEGSASVPYL